MKSLISEKRPIWFDIDGTLLHTKAGHGAFQLALEEVYGWRDTLAEVRFAGNTDLRVLLDLADKHGGCPHETRSKQERFFTNMAGHLDRGLHVEGPELVPGAMELVLNLRAREDVCLGLLTGNARLCAMIKLRHVGLDGHFPDGAFGDQHHDRNHLARLAVDVMKGEAGGNGGAVGRKGLVIGDTTRDVRAAKEIGARCLAVATGSDGPEELMAAGADRVVTDLHPTPVLLDWILGE
ncbi:MAG: haloacid dehalogenase-like hydrolase [Verrucomicrobia bacterium]|nr:haloacid dehalogenase-like hydrolase [Verrucomicrobiota bacterium]MCH8511928.1 haloacid dehalogenase-like hydrolase [Kiritimatiellia bacterium]